MYEKETNHAFDELPHGVNNTRKGFIGRLSCNGVAMEQGKKKQVPLCSWNSDRNYTPNEAVHEGMN